MTIQQLKYIVALERFRSFALAADHCGVTQPTLSKMVAKLEEELDLRLFDRTNRRVDPTAAGMRVIRQAVRAVREAERISEIVADEKEALTGELRLAVGPSIAPYILPQFIRVYGESCPQVSLSVEEMRPGDIAGALRSGRIDAAIAVGGNRSDDVAEIPLYNEPFMVYLAESCRRRMPTFTPEMLSHESMWVMKEAQCLRESAFSFCKARETGRRVYEAGNIDTLVRVVDANGGFTIIPEMHLPFLSESQRRNVRPLEGDSSSMRRVSMYIRHDYVRQAIVNSVIAALLRFIPRRMADPYILRGPIRL